MRLFQSIRSRLFCCYATLIIIILSIFTLSFYQYASYITKEKAADSLQQLSISVATSIDAELKNMSAIANRIIASPVIKDTFFTGIDYSRITPQDKFHFFNLLLTVTGPSLDYQINLMDLEGRFIEFGKIFDIYVRSPQETSDKQWIQDAIHLEGVPTITSPHVNDWSRKEYPIISVARSFYEVFGGPYTGVVEVQQYTYFFKDMLLTTLSAYSNPVSIYIYDANGQTIYASNDFLTDLDYTTYIQPIPDRQGFLSLDINQEKHTISFFQSEYSQWTIVIAESLTTLLAPIQKLRYMFLLFGAIALIVTLLITYMISRQLTIPISGLYQSILQVDLADLNATPLISLGTTTYELEALNQAYTNMIIRLEQSLSATVTARTHEIEAKFLALQAQMNPHFLYNTITTMSIKAEENHQEELVDMCDNLIHMLRYITRDTTGLVPLKEEVAHLQQYLALMKVRYPTEFEITYAIPNDMLSLPVPKLILQPLVENCFKHGFTIRPPWTIALYGEETTTGWSITVTDNGKGFSAQAPTSPTTSHIGLSNIRERLLYHYQAHAIFIITNHPTGGASIQIGGIRKEHYHA